MDKRRALITGITGQDGCYLAKFLLEKDYKVFGMMRRHSNPNLENLKFLGIERDVDIVVGDVSDAASVRNVLRLTKPHEVYNLAAQSFVGISWEMPEETFQTNTMGVLYLLEGIREITPKTRFYQASTSEMFGLSRNPDNTQDENTPFYPRSPYGISKLAAHWTTVNYRESYGLFCCSGILMNHESPIRGKEFVTRKITDGFARIKAGLDTKIKLGNLDVWRDWGFAGDYVEAMWMMLQQENPDDYVIATGEAHSLKEFLNKACEYAGIGTDGMKYVEVDPSLVRPAEVPYLRGNPHKARTKLGWKPRTSFDDLVKMMVEADLKRYGV